MIILSVDWDFFFPVPEDGFELYDWAHSELSKFMTEGIWNFRAAEFLRSGNKLPDTSGEELTFWNRFKFNKNADMYFADSHANIARSELFTPWPTLLWNFDVHHDAYETMRSQLDKSGNVTCENWATLLSGYFKVVNFVPKWAEYRLREDKPRASVERQLDPGKNFKRTIDRIFVCRSGAWTPTWVEEKFWKFIESCPVTAKSNMDNMQPRQFKIEDAKMIADIQNKAIMEAVKSAGRGAK